MCAQMKLIIALSLLVAGPCAATECRNTTLGMDDVCSLVLVPGESVLTIPGVSKMCGMMFAAHVYTNHYDTIKTEIQAYCASAGATVCCPTATLGMVATKGTQCEKESGKETKSCESGSEVGKPDTSGSYNSWIPYSLNVAGGKEFKAYFGCDANCGKTLIAGLEGYSLGSGKDALVATLLAEFKGDATAKIPSIYPKQTLYGGKIYPCKVKDGCCAPNPTQDDAKSQTSFCTCRLNSTAWNKKPAFCSQTMAGSPSSGTTLGNTPTDGTTSIAVGFKFAPAVAVTIFSVAFLF